eukprot:366449-Chlamydomonas_euryale.AAC.10
MHACPAPFRKALRVVTPKLGSWRCFDAHVRQAGNEVVTYSEQLWRRRHRSGHTVAVATGSGRALVAAAAPLPPASLSLLGAYLQAQSNARNFRLCVGDAKVDGRSCAGSSRSGSEGQAGLPLRGRAPEPLRVRVLWMLQGTSIPPAIGVPRNSGAPPSHVDEVSASSADGEGWASMRVTWPAARC